MNMSRLLHRVGGLVLVAGLACVLLVVTGAHAQTFLPGVLVSNMSVTDHGSISNRVQYAQEFTTGSSSHGYRLTEVDILHHRIGPKTGAEVQVCEESNDAPSSTCWTLTAQSSGRVFRRTYAATQPYPVLAASTSYFVVVTPFQEDGIQSTQSRAEDDTSLDGWTIADTLLARSSTSGAWDTNGGAFIMIMEIKGRARGGPGVLAQMEVAALDRRAVVNWTLPFDDGGSPVTEYQIRYDQPHLLTQDDAKSAWLPVGRSRTFTARNLENDVTYRFQVRAVNDLGNGQENTRDATPSKTLVTGRPGARGVQPSNFEFAQGFTTGDNPHGYRFQEITLFFQSELVPTVELWVEHREGHASRRPGADPAPGRMAWRLRPKAGSFTNDGGTFQAPDDAYLEPNTPYYLYLSFGPTTTTNTIAFFSDTRRVSSPHWTVHRKAWTRSYDPDRTPADSYQDWLHAIANPIYFSLVGDALDGPNPTAPEPPDDDVDWKTSLTVGHWHLLGRERERGWRRDVCDRQFADVSNLEAHSDTDLCYGSIESRTLTVDGTNYPLVGIYQFVSPGNETLRIEFDQEIDFSAWADWSFWINGQEFPVADRTIPQGTRGDHLDWNGSMWTGANGWTVGETVWVGLMAQDRTPEPPVTPPTTPTTTGNLLLKTAVNDQGTFSTRNVMGQIFETGAHADGYRITHVGFHHGGLINPSQEDGNASIEAAIYTVETDLPQSSLFDFGSISRTEDSGGGPFFDSLTAPSTAILQPNTKYAIVIDPDSISTSVAMHTVSSATATGDSAAGWSIDGFAVVDSDSNPENLNWQRQSVAFRIQVNGHPVPPTLSALALSVGTDSPLTLSPAFDATTTDYTTTVPHATQQVTVSATATRDTAAVTFPADANDKVPGVQVTLNEGENAIPVTVTAADGVTQRTYTITVDRLAITARNRVPGSSRGLTARFLDPPTGHDGSTPFELDLRFSAEIPGLGYETVRDHVLLVTNGTITGARRAVKGRNHRWILTVEPTAPAPITVTVPEATDCKATGAICTGKGAQKVAEETLTIPVHPLGAGFDGVPFEHDGESPFTIDVYFTEHVRDLSFRTMAGPAFQVTHGTVTGARRLVKRQNRQWRVTIEPSGLEDVTILLPETTDCTATGAICQPDGRKLSHAVATQVHGPLALSVADAEVEEAADATLDFVVTLNRPATESVTVNYTTADGTATADQDYTTTSGTLTFAAGTTTQTVPVPVLDDAHDEGEETLTFTLSNARGATGAVLADATATGTINNNDPLQRAWLSRFGRTVGTHVTDAIGERLRTSPDQGSSLTIGGTQVPLTSRTTSDEKEASPLLRGVAQMLGLGGGSAASPADADPRLNQGQSPDVDLRSLLLRSSFRLHMNPSGAALPSLTAWGRFAGTAFQGQDGDLDLDGDVFTGTVGIDGTWDRAIAGLAVAHSRGEGTFAMDGTEDRGQGDLEQTMTSFHPYLRYAVTDRLDVWGVLGYGRGELEMDMANGLTIETDSTMIMGSLGGRGILLEAAETGGFQLATRTDFMGTRTSSDAVAEMVASDGEAHRLRLILEGSHGFMWEDGRSLTPTMELGVRHDWGDAEEGFGLEVGGRVQYADPSLGLTIDGTVRGLLAHEDDEYHEWGASGTVRLAPGRRGHGLSLTLAPAVGVTASGVDGLWSRQTTQGLAPPGSARASAGRLAADVGYGVPLETGLLTPYAGTVFSEGTDRRYRVGTRWQTLAGLMLNLEGTRQDSGAHPVNQGVRLQVGWGF